MRSYFCVRLAFAGSFLFICHLQLAAEENFFSAKKTPSVLLPFPSEIDLGKMLQGEIKDVIVTLVNKSPYEGRVIDKLAVSCNCIDGKLSVNRIPPQGVARLAIKVAAGSSKANAVREFI